EDEIFMLIKGEALLWLGDEQMELSEGGIVYLPRNIPHGYRITSDTADLLMITTPGGIEGMFQQAGRDITTPRPKDFAITPERLAEASEKYGQVILGPPR
ncbi:cupin domain-containing protein, partial [Streptomyces sp. NPDC002623]